MDRNASLEEITGLISDTLNHFYEEDKLLFDRRGGEGLHERCLQAKFAHHLQNFLNAACNGSVDWYVDCEYNSSWVPKLDEHGNVERDDNGMVIYHESRIKALKNFSEKHGGFVDIIVHKRLKTETDWFCIELKKLSTLETYSQRRRNQEKNNDFSKLIQMTSQTTAGFGYYYGFYIVLGRVREETKWTVFRRGEISNLIDVSV